MNYKQILLELIKEKKVRVGVIGLGYVGLPLAGFFAKKNLMFLVLILIKKKFPN